MLDELKTFIAVVEHENFTKAAASINISQPSVSVHIKNLEEYFQTVLVSRSVKHKNLIITENGKVLYKRAKEIVRLLNETRQELSGANDTTVGCVTIGSIQAVLESLLPEFLCSFTKKYPEIKIKVYADNTDYINKKVTELKYDVGIVSGSSSYQSLNQSFILEDRMVIIYSKDRPTQLKNVEDFDLVNERWIIRERGSGTRNYFNTYLANRGLVLENVMMLGNNHAIIEAVKNGVGISMMSYLAAKNSIEAGEVGSVIVGDDYMRKISLVTLNDYMLSKPTKLFIDDFKEYLQEKSADLLL